MNNEARIDKWLWAARIFKTRSIAVDAIKNNRVRVKGTNVKPSHTVKAGDVTWTPDGSGHGLSNENGKEDVVFMALIINS